MHDWYTLLIRNTGLLVAYRWLAWAGAAIVLIIDAVPTTLPNITLLSLIALLNLGLTLARTSYTPLIRSKPLYLLGDGILALLIVFCSGSELLPFYPYALAALITPALLFGWRTALLATSIFISVDLLLIWLGTWLSGSPLPPLLLRIQLPIAFSALWVLVQHYLLRPPDPYAPLPKPNVTRFTSLSRPPFVESPLERRKRWSESLTPTLLEKPRLQPAVQTEPEAPRSALPLSRPQMSDLRQAMHASIATEANFDVALHRLMEHFNRHTTVTLTLNHIGPAQPLRPVQQRTLLRLATEALVNVDQHANAHAALLTLSFAGDAVTVTIEDDGVGLLDGTYMRPGMHALRALDYCFAELGGTLSVGENAHGGVVVHARLPLTPAEPPPTLPPHTA